MATSSRSRRFSARSRLISSFSSLVTPGASPASISAWATQRRKDSLPTPVCLATASTAAVLVGYSARCSITRHTALAFSSGSNFFGMNCILPTQKDAASNLGRFNRDLLCTADPICHRSREGLAEIHRGLKDELLPGLQKAANGATRIARGQGHLAGGFDRLASGLSQAQRGADRIAEGQRLLRTRLGQMADGTSQIAQNADAFAPSIEDLIDQTSVLAENLQRSESYLRTVNRGADTSEAGGFYLPARTLRDERFAYAREVFLSPDGRVARIQVTGDTDPLSPDGLRRFEEVQDTADTALKQTRLADATMSGTGAAGLGADLNRYLYDDAKLVLAAVLLVVLLLLIITLRSLAAPLYLLVSVALSCAAALGLTTLVFQDILGHDIQFPVPVITFVLLVAVGAATTSCC